MGPEQQRAIQVLLLNLPHWKEYYQPEVGSEFAQIPMFSSNFMAFSTEPFRKLPHDDTWIWNQSNAKVTTELDQYHECTLQKMNTRKRKNCPKAPSYKIWLYALNKKNQPSHLYFLWCEKGVSQKQQMTPLISQNDLQCLDYNFTPKLSTLSTPSPHMITTLLKRVSTSPLMTSPSFVLSWTKKSLPNSVGANFSSVVYLSLSC